MNPFRTVRMPRSIALSVAMIILAPGIAGADPKTEITNAVKWAGPALGKTCDFSGLDDGELADSQYFEIRYRYKGQDQDEADKVFPLIQLFCSAGAYSASYVYLTRDSDGYRLLAFAEPQLDYDYTDEDFTRLKAPPKVTGFTATTFLTDPEYDETAKSISMAAKWRGIGDAWSTGTWQFVEGQFVLKQYDVDPTYQDNTDDGEQNDTSQPESYQVYPTVEPRSE